MRLVSTLVALLFLAACGTGGRYAEPSYSGDAALAEAVYQENALHMRGGRSSDAAYYADGVRIQPVSDRKLARTARLALSTADGDAIPQIVAHADTTIARLGGYAVVATERARTYRVPSESLDAALRVLETLGNAKIEQREVRVVDVTAQYTDLEADLANQRALLARLREIAAQATTVSELLEVERELARVTGRIDALERQLRPLEARVRLATLSFDVWERERTRPGPLGWVLLTTWRAVEWLFVWE